ncbi:hypothetical protein TNCV_1013461 [Trichonephila clavipes]|uniref:Uncharacterized protein n=1 Tax=Trichonephila clavipes TaxID=2585209 RepID=A0A8X6VXM9_TRICX|nr:hypothetical protein TNCV_1013461 [Trichonephila clavipes]
MLHLFFGIWDTGARITLRQKHQLLDMLIHFKTLLLYGPVTIQPVKARRKYIFIMCDNEKLEKKATRKIITLETKMQEIRRLDSGERQSQISAALNLATSTRCLLDKEAENWKQRIE